MSLDSIIEHILKEAEAEKEKIIQQAQQERAALIQQTKKEADQLYHHSIETETARLERQKQGLIVQARIESKKQLLKTKQELIDTAFVRLKSTLKKDKLKKEQISYDKIDEVNEDIDFYLNKVRPDYETEIAKILFG